MISSPARKCRVSTIARIFSQEPFGKFSRKINAFVADLPDALASADTPVGYSKKLIPPPADHAFDSDESQAQVARVRPTFLRVCPGTSNGITEFSEHEAD